MDQRKQQSSSHDEPNFIQTSGRRENASVTKNENHLEKKRAGVAVN